ncbi:MAG: cell division protein ZapA [Syntrophomonadaceae bacterium]|jgi:cell division protein ZapA|nr:cell division protein ZapA [Syntrophomonadaceae bacterium]
MDEFKNHINRAEVKIFNEEYTVTGDENTEYIHMLAGYIDRRMKIIQQRNPNLSSSKIGVLLALNLADEINKLQDDYDEIVKDLEDARKKQP